MMYESVCWKRHLTYNLSIGLCNFVWALLKTTYTGMQWMGEGIYLMFVYLCTREMSYSYEIYEV